MLHLSNGLDVALRQMKFGDHTLGVMSGDQNPWAAFEKLKGKGRKEDEPKATIVNAMGG